MTPEGPGSRTARSSALSYRGQFLIQRRRLKPLYYTHVPSTEAAEQRKDVRVSDPTIRAAIIAAAVALVVGLLGQVVSVANQILTHRLTQRRETEKYYNEVYQKLFAPVISDVFLYIDMVTNYRRRHDTTEEQEIEVKDRAIGYIQQNLVYGSPKLLSAYHQIHSHAITDQSGMNPSTPELHLLYEFVQEYERVIKRSSIFSAPNEAEQLAPVYLRLILYLLYINNLGELAIYNWRFDPRAATRKNYEKIERIIWKQNAFERALVYQPQNKQKIVTRRATVQQILDLMVKDRREREDVVRSIIQYGTFLKEQAPPIPGPG